MFSETIICAEGEPRLAQASPSVLVSNGKQPRAKPQPGFGEIWEIETRNLTALRGQVPWAHIAQLMPCPRHLTEDTQ